MKFILLLVIITLSTSKLPFTEENITLTATEVKYPEKCTTFPNGTKFQILYDNDFNGKANLHLKVNSLNFESVCNFEGKTANCECKDDVSGDGDLKISENLVVVSDYYSTANLSIPDDVNKPASKYNYQYVDLSPSLNTSQTFTFNNSNYTTETLKILFKKDLLDKLPVFVEETQKELNCTSENNVLSCQVNTFDFPLNKEDNHTQMNYTVKVKNACGDFYDQVIKVSVQSSNYIKVFGLVSLLLLVIF